ncbi:serine hydrolase [Lentzea sp. NBRC 105346]|uniref:serine hydrolase domain-containing protein n=1 Tax=Lentzea sp. NBRC 105346 TaxID=3032205 RepID=UPI0024A2C272|nr:serine hydrolase domain-containing protein [Lentzea sp. NBRC 105346]GLZ28593.1 serine hydrolase [Lentzea sp. NBRC 105346]
MEHANLSHLLEKLARHHLIPGAQLVVHRQGTTEAFEFGEQVHAGGLPMSREARVPVGSISKTFTASLAMILASDGDLDLDEPLAEYLPEAGGLSDRLTARHLLSHTGGLPSEPDEVRATTLRKHVLDCCRRVRPMHEPGDGFSYSNIGYSLAGHLIEVVTGMSWWEAMSSILLQPLGVRPHFVVAPGGGHVSVPGHAVNPARGRIVPVQQSLTLVDAPAGAIAASATDLALLGELLAGRGPELIGTAELKEMRLPVAGAEPFGMADAWGLGVALYDDGWFGHDGTGDGTSCHLRVHPESGTVVALTTNGSTGFAMWREFAREAGIGDYDPLRQLGKPLESAPEFTGRFYNGDTEYSVIPGHEAPLRLVVDGEPFAELTLYDGLMFAMRDVDTGETNQSGRFIRDSSNYEIGWLQVGGRLARRHVAA